MRVRDAKRADKFAIRIAHHHPHKARQLLFFYSRMKERCRRRNFHARDTGREEEGTRWLKRAAVCSDRYCKVRTERDINQGDVTGNWIWSICLRNDFREIWGMGKLPIYHRKVCKIVVRRTLNVWSAHRVARLFLHKLKVLLPRIEGRSPTWFKRH